MSTPLRRALRLIAGLALLVALAVGVVPPAHAVPGLSLAGKARFVVDPAAGVVTASQTITITHRKPNSGNSYFYWDQWAIPIPSSASEIAVTSGGKKVASSTKAAKNPGFVNLYITFPSRLRYGQSRTFVVTYKLAKADFRSQDAARVGQGYASFPVFVDGDAGHVTVEVVAPSTMELTSSSDTFTSQQSGATTTWTSTELTGSDYFAAQLALTSEASAPTGTLSVNLRKIELYAFPGDTAWSDFVTTNVPKALDELSKLTGRPIPDNLKQIHEDVSLAASGYDGGFYASSSTIRLSENLDLTTLCHELAHLWINRNVSDERWLTEGLAEDLASRTVKALGGNAALAPTVTRSDAHAIPLEDWKPSQLADDTEAWAYPASHQTVQELVSVLSDAEYTTFVSALATKDAPYGNAGITSRTTLGWRGVVDTIENLRSQVTPDASGRTPTAVTVSDWVLAEPASVDWMARAKARATYAELDARDGDWTPPLAVRDPLRAWDFTTAATELDRAVPLGPTAARVQQLASQAGVDDDGVQQLYETADTAGELVDLEHTLTLAADTLDALDSAKAEGAASLPTVGWARAVLGVDADAAAASTAFTAGDLDLASTYARAAKRGSGQVGVVAWSLLGACLAGVALVGGLAFVLVRRSRQPRVDAAAAPAVEAPSPLAGYSGAYQPGYPPAYPPQPTNAMDPTSPPTPPLRRRGG